MNALKGAGWREEAFLLPCAEGEIVAIATLPDIPATTGLVIVPGGPQYRAGAHRQNVLLARSLAARGTASLRLDCRGMGDATGTHPGFEHLGPELGAAITALRARVPTLARLFLWGLCDGASGILLQLSTLPIAPTGVILVNPWARSEAGLAAAQLSGYLPRRALSGEFWGKLLTGKINPFAKILEVLRLTRTSRGMQDGASLPARLRGILATTQVPSLVILAQDDMTGLEFRSTVLEPIGKPGPAPRTVHLLAETDHTFSAPEKWAEVEALVQSWIGHG